MAYFLVHLQPLQAINSDQAREVIQDPEFIISLSRNFDVLAALDGRAIHDLCLKIPPYKLSKIYQGAFLLDEMRDHDFSNISSTPEPPDYQLTISTDDVEFVHGNGNLRSQNPVPFHSAASPYLETKQDSYIELPPPATLNRRSPLSSSDDPVPLFFSTSPLEDIPQLASPEIPAITISPSPQSNFRIASARGLSSASTPLFYDSSEEDANSPRPQDSVLHVTDPQNNEPHPQRYIQALGIMTSVFGSTLSQKQLADIIKTGEQLVRSDAVSFLKDQLVIWKGMWDASGFPAPANEASTMEHFLKISQYISILEERSTVDRIRILFHKILQYQYYIRIQEDFKQHIDKFKISLEPGVGRATYAMDIILAQLYADDWDSIDKAEKLDRRKTIHQKNHFGKRLTKLSAYFGLGILLLASPEAMGRINNTKFSDDMVIALICYSINVYPKLPIVGQALDQVVRHMIQSLPLEQIRPYLEGVLPNVQCILDSQKDFKPLLNLTRFDQEVHRVELLEVSSGETELNTRGRTIEVDVHSSRKRHRKDKLLDSL